MEDGGYCYRFQIGTISFIRYGMDDRTSRRLLARWIRRYWERHCERMATVYAGSIADATDNGWYTPPEAGISRLYCPNWIVPCDVRPVVVERFNADENGIREFLRVWL